MGKLLVTSPRSRGTDPRALGCWWHGRCRRGHDVSVFLAGDAVQLIRDVV